MRTTTVSVYAEMLKMALEVDQPGGRTMAELTAEAVARRLDLDGGGDTASRLARALAYDVTLVHLCERLGVAHEMTGEAAGPGARRQTERRLAALLPELGSGIRQT